MVSFRTYVGSNWSKTTSRNALFNFLLFQTCDFTLFWFSYTVMILGWITVLLVLVWLVNKYGRTLFNCMTCNKYGY